MKRIATVLALTAVVGTIGGAAPAHAATQIRCRLDPVSLDVTSSDYKRRNRAHLVTSTAEGITIMECTDGGAPWREEVAISQRTDSLTKKKGNLCIVRNRFNARIERLQGDDIVLAARTTTRDVPCSSPPYVVAAKVIDGTYKPGEGVTLRDVDVEIAYTYDVVGNTLGVINTDMIDFVFSMPAPR